MDSRNHNRNENIPWYRSIRSVVVLMAFMAICIMYLHRIIMSQALPMICFDQGWSKKQESWVHSSFYLGYIFTQIVGGVLSIKYGGIPIAFIGILVSSLATLLTPMLVNHYPAVIIARILTGLGEGVMYPSLLKVMSNWILPENRALSISLAWSGGQIGTIISLGGYLYISDTIGWQGPFYIFAFLGILWILIWAIYITETPENNRFITPSEKSLIISKIGSSTTTSKTNTRAHKIPWALLFTNRSVYALILLFYSYNWSFYLLISYLPRYLSAVLGYTSNTQGLISMLPYVGLWISSNISGFLVDYAIGLGINKIAVKKIFIMAGLFPPALLFVMISRIESRHIIIVSLFFCTTISGVANSVLTPLAMDISLSQASMIIGVSNFIGGSAGIASPAVAGLFLHLGECKGIYPEEEKCKLYWNLLFYLASLIYVVGICCIVILFNPTGYLGNEQGSKSTVDTIDDEKNEKDTAIC